MIYSDNLTNRELLMNAMPLSSLSREQWKVIFKHLESLERSNKTDLLEVLQTLCSNQSKLEVINNYTEYYFDTLNNSVPNVNCNISVL